MLTECVCCGLETVGRDYERGGFSCGSCGIEKDSDAWKKITELRAERDRLREDLALAIHTISHQLDNIPKEMRRIAADRIAQFRETLARAALEGKG